MSPFFVFGVLILGYVNDIFGQGDLPPYITKCGRKNYEQCVIAQHKKVIKNMQFGIKELGFPNMNPFHVESVSIISPDMAMKMIDVSVYGLNDTDIRKMNYDFEKRVNDVLMYNSRIELSGDCEMKGRISILNLEGQGRLKLVLKGVLSHLKAQYALRRDKKGFQYFYVKNVTSSYTIEGMEIEMQDLFPNEDLNRQLNQIFNENWKAFNEMIHDHVLTMINQVISKAVNGFMRHVPYEKVFAAD